MHTNVDDVFDVDEEFSVALALLHSTEHDSAKKLRRMLDALIEKRYGRHRTLAVRMSKSVAHSKRDYRESFTSVRGPIRSYAVKKHRETNQEQKRSKKLLKYDTAFTFKSNASEEKLASDTHETFRVNFDQNIDKEEIPRISIPDEESNDGALCKVCNGAKLGPLILLECQECQDVYHPLCHHPPVIDIDVYDPSRIIWKCGKCVRMKESITRNKTNHVQKKLVYSNKKNSKKEC